MIDPATYSARLMARVQSVCAQRQAALRERDEFRAQLENARADILAMLAPLAKLGALLPEPVRAILAKYQS